MKFKFVIVFILIFICRIIICSPNEDLIQAVKNGNLNDVKKAVENGADVNTAVYYGDIYVFCMAIHDGHLEIAKYLLSKGAKKTNLNRQFFDPDDTPLLMNIYRKNTKMVDFLLEIGADVNDVYEFFDNNSPLIEAVKENYPDIVEVILKYEPDIYHKNKFGYTAMMLAQEMNHSDIVEIFAEYGILNEASSTVELFKAINNNNTKKFISAIQNGADINEYNYEGYTPLSLSVYKNNIEFVKILLSKNADINKTDYFSPLIIAARKSKSEIIELLIDHGADIGYHIPHGGDALHYAIRNRNMDCVKLIISTGYDCSEAFFGVFSWKIDEYYSEVIKLLLNSNFDASKKYRGGKTLIEAALEDGHKDIAKMIEKKSNSWQMEYRLVTADIGLRMRSLPSLKGTKTGVIPFNEKVLILEEVGKKQTISGATGKWCKINWNNRVGWVFGGFLEKIK